MFGNLRLGYWLLIGLTGGVVAIAALVGARPITTLLTVRAFPTTILIWSAPVLIWFGLLAVEVMRRRVDRPLAAIIRVTVLRRLWLLRGVLLIGLSIPAARSVNSLKIAIPDFVPFYADPYFIVADKLLLGTDAWRITHALLGPLATVMIDRIYILWFMVVMATLAWLAFTRDQRFQLRGLLSYYLTWIVLGTIVATSWSSVGPCFYRDFYGNNYFAPMMDSLDRYDGHYSLKAFQVMAFLMNDFQTGKFGSGISAMPSMHVAMAFLTFLLCRKGLGNHWVSYGAAVFAVVTTIGSVHLGWHYAVDALVSIFVVWPIWLACGRFVERLERTSAEPSPRPGFTLAFSAKSSRRC